MDPSPTAVLTVQGLTHRYREGEHVREVLTELALEVNAGEIVALLGPSGSGKSTLLNLISGIEPPTKGRIRFAGRELTTLSEHERTLLRRRHLGFVYQLFNLIPTLTVEENLRLPLALNGERNGELDSGRAGADVLDMLGAVGLRDRADSFPDRLSGGEQQRVAIARALIHHPTLVLADEPTGNLDAHTGRRILDLLEDMVRTRGGSLLLVTHAAEVARRADRILYLEQGRVVPYTGEAGW